MRIQMKLTDGTIIPQGRWERTTEPFSDARRRYLEAIESIDDSQTKMMFQNRVARLVDRVQLRTSQVRCWIETNCVGNWLVNWSRC